MMSQVFHADCMDIMKQYPDGYFDLAVVDPPYGINAPQMAMGSNKTRTKGGYPATSTAERLRKGRLNSGGGKLKKRALNTMDCSWDEEPPPAEYWTELFRVSRNQIVWGGNYFPLPPTRGIIVWDKLQPWENFSQVEIAWTSFDVPASIFRLSNTGGRNGEKKIHPTQKPVTLYDWIYGKFLKHCNVPTDRRPMILDTHLGSGSNRISAHRADLDFVGCEKNHSIYLSQERRYKTFAAQLTLF
jgi:site-specific DNA-methyltransferase (adenine-specific)